MGEGGKKKPHLSTASKEGNPETGQLSLPPRKLPHLSFVTSTKKTATPNISARRINSEFWAAWLASAHGLVVRIREYSDHKTNYDDLPCAAMSTSQVPNYQLV